MRPGEGPGPVDPIRRGRSGGGGDGIESVRLTPTPLEGQGFTVGITSFPPGTSIRLHSHNTIEQV